MNRNIIILGTALFFAACGGKGTTDKKTELENLKKQQTELNEKISSIEKEMMKDGSEQNEHVKNVGLTTVQAQRFAHYIELQAKVDADENISISAKMPGVVSRILVKQGDEVKTGQILAELDNDVMQQGLEELKTAFTFANNLFMKQKNLWEQKIGTEVQYLSAKNNKEALEKKISTMNEQIDQSRMKSPINGTVDAVDIKIGQTVMPGLSYIRVVNFNSLKVKADAPESYASKIKIGNSVDIEFPDLNEQAKSVIRYAAKVINPLSRTFAVEAMLDSKGDYHPNMLAVIKIVDYSNDSAMVVPLNLIQNTEEGSVLFISKKDGTKTSAKKVLVKTGLTYKGKIEILSGLKNGDMVITTGFQDLNDGESIQQ